MPITLHAVTVFPHTVIRQVNFLPKIFLWPHYSGAPGAQGPRFIEPPEPSVLTPLKGYYSTRVPPGAATGRTV